MRANFILGLVGSLVTLVLLFEMMRRQRLREKYAVFWALVALLTLLVAIFPQLLSMAADLVGVAVPANLLFFLASMLLLVVSIQHSYELGRLEDRTRTLAEELALTRMEMEMARPTSGRGETDRSGHPDELTGQAPDTTARSWARCGLRKMNRRNAQNRAAVPSPRPTTFAAMLSENGSSSPRT